MGVDREAIEGVPRDPAGLAERVPPPGFNDIAQGMTIMRDSASGRAAA